MMFKRKIYDQILAWKKESDGRTALLIEGPRRVGKSTVVKEFAAKEYKSCIFIDFADAAKETVELFDDISDLNYLFLRLQLQYRVDLYERESVIVFDEVQLCPKARQAIRALVNDHRYDYIETGSLISIKKNVKNIRIPSEERRINMYPMDYEEFLWAQGDTVTSALLGKCLASGIGLGEKENRKQLRKYRQYMLVGGMPQAVDTYLRTNNFKEVDQIKRDILDLYESDLMKIDPTGRLSAMFDAIPAQLNKNASRYQTTTVIGSQSSDRVLKYISELADSKIVLVSYHTDDPNIGLANTKGLSRFKLFVCDTGLLTTLMFKDRDFTENEIYEKLLSDKLSVNLGYLYENAVAQALAAHGNRLFYHTMKNGQSGHFYEVDFLLIRKNQICPIEVKSSSYKTHKSLDLFCEKYSPRIMSKYLIYTKDLQKDKDVVCLPVYMTPFIR